MGFFNELKWKVVSDTDYTTSFYLFNLKLCHLGDINDLYNVQDVILLSQICENRFQFMHDSYGFNPRKCNLANTLSGCIEREMSKIIALPTSNEVLDIFEQTVTGGFNCVSNRLAFDSEIVLPNANKNDQNYRKDYNFEIAYHIKLVFKKTTKKNYFKNT